MKNLGHRESSKQLMLGAAQSRADDLRKDAGWRARKLRKMLLAFPPSERGDVGGPQPQQKRQAKVAAEAAQSRSFNSAYNAAVLGIEPSDAKAADADDGGSDPEEDFDRDGSDDGSEPQGEFGVVRSILAKAPHHRRPDEQRRLRAVVDERMHFLPLPDDKKDRICEVMRFKQANGNTLLFRQGDRADKFYVILSGEVVGEKMAGAERIRFVLRAGDSFGEAGLLNNAPRNATCSVPRGAELLTVSKKHYERILQPSGLEREARKEFLKSCSAFSDLTRAQIASLEPFCFPGRFQPGSVVVSAGNVSEYLFLVAAGDAIVTMAPTAEKNLGDKGADDRHRSVLRQFNRKTRQLERSGFASSQLDQHEVARLSIGEAFGLSCLTRSHVVEEQAGLDRTVQPAAVRAGRRALEVYMVPVAEVEKQVPRGIRRAWMRLAQKRFAWWAERFQTSVEVSGAVKRMRGGGGPVVVSSAALEAAEHAAHMVSAFGSHGGQAALKAVDVRKGRAGTHSGRVDTHVLHASAQSFKVGGERGRRDRGAHKAYGPLGSHRGRVGPAGGSDGFANPKAPAAGTQRRREIGDLTPAEQAELRREEKRRRVEQRLNGRRLSTGIWPEFLLKDAQQYPPPPKPEEEFVTVRGRDGHARVVLNERLRKEKEQRERLSEQQARRRAVRSQWAAEQAEELRRAEVAKERSVLVRSVTRGGHVGTMDGNAAEKDSNGELADILVGSRSVAYGDIRQPVDVPVHNPAPPMPFSPVAALHGTSSFRYARTLPPAGTDSPGSHRDSRGIGAGGSHGGGKYAGVARGKGTGLSQTVPLGTLTGGGTVAAARRAAAEQLTLSRFAGESEAHQRATHSVARLKSRAAIEPRAPAVPSMHVKHATAEDQDSRLTLSRLQRRLEKPTDTVPESTVQGLAELAEIGGFRDGGIGAGAAGGSRASSAHPLALPSQSMLIRLGGPADAASGAQTPLVKVGGLPSPLSRGPALANRADSLAISPTSAAGSRLGTGVKFTLGALPATSEVDVAGPDDEGDSDAAAGRILEAGGGDEAPAGGGNGAARKAGDDTDKQPTNAHKLRAKFRAAARHVMAAQHIASFASIHETMPRYAPTVRTESFSLAGKLQANSKTKRQRALQSKFMEQQERESKRESYRVRNVL